MMVSVGSTCRSAAPPSTCVRDRDCGGGRGQFQGVLRSAGVCSLAHTDVQACVVASVLSVMHAVAGVYAGTEGGGRGLRLAG